jgi:hypothetical protein
LAPFIDVQLQYEFVIIQVGSRFPPIFMYVG